MTSAELERLVTGRLQSLPLVRAPHTLLPRVLAAVQAWSNRPWYSRAWFTWPLAGQVAALCLIGLGGAALLAQGEMVADWVSSIVSMRLDPYFASLAERLASLMTAARVLWAAIGEPVAPYVGLLLVLMCASAAACAAALGRVFGRTLQS